MDLIVGIRDFLLNYCPVCSRALRTHHEQNVRFCPRGCGHAGVGEDSDGLPIITFKPTEKGY